MTFTDEQLNAIRTDGDRLVISAGAGAGKTRVIVERIARHVLEDGVPLEAIAAMSFTRKSSAELRERLARRFAEAGRDDLAALAETGVVRTIDAWAAESLRSRGALAGVDPTFVVVSGDGLKAMLHEAARAAIARARELGPAARDVVTELTARTAWSGGGPLSIYAQAENAIVDALVGFRKGGLSRPEISAIYRDEMTLGNAFRRAIRETLTEEQAAALQDGPDLRADVRSVFLKDKPPAWTNPEGTLYGSLGLARLAIAAWAELEAEMDRTGRFDHDETSARLANLIGERPDIAASLRARNRIVIVDEAQDLSPLQMRLLETLSPESLVLVGDARQSIYRFRDADPALFRAAAARVRRLDLTRNHRIVDGRLGGFLDGFFGKLWEGSHEPIRTVEGGEGAPPVVLRRRGKEAWHEVVEEAAAAATDDPSEVAILVQKHAEIAAVARAAAAIGLPVTAGGRDEAFVATLEVRDVANLLAALLDPLDDAALLAALHSPAGGFTLDDLVRWSGDGPVWMAFARERSDPRVARFLDWFEPLSAVADRYPAWEVVARLLADSPLVAGYAAHPARERSLPRLDRLATMAMDRPGETTAGFADRLRLLQEIRYRAAEGDVAPESRDRVRVMTIFAAKGLEFDTVIAAATTFRGPQPDDLRMDRTRGLLAFRTAEGPSVAYAFLESREKKAHEDENERKLYVAMTRARRKLVLFAESAIDGRYATTARMARILSDPLPGTDGPLPPK